MTGSSSFTGAVMIQQPAMAAEVLLRAETIDAATLLEQQSDEHAAAILEFMPPWSIAALLNAVSSEKAAAVVNEMPTRTAIGTLRSLNDAERSSIIAALPAKTADALSASLAYRETQVGAWMTRNIPVVPADSTVGDIDRILDTTNHRDHVYLVSPAQLFVGVAATTKLLEAAPNTPVSQLANKTIQQLSDTTTITQAIDLPAWDDFLRLPIVGHAGTLIGDVSRKALRSALEQTRAPEADLQTETILGAMTGAYVTSVSGLLQLASHQAVRGAKP